MAKLFEMRGAIKSTTIQLYRIVLCLHDYTEMNDIYNTLPTDQALGYERLNGAHVPLDDAQHDHGDSDGPVDHLEETLARGGGGGAGGGGAHGGAHSAHGIARTHLVNRFLLIVNTCSLFANADMTQMSLAAIVCTFFFSLP